MYDTINTKKDMLKEKYIFASELTGKYNFPQLPENNAYFDNLRAVPFNLAATEKYPKNCLCHFFIDDEGFERVWNNADKYIPMLKNFKYVCTPDFSFYNDMPLAMQIWQVYKNRALSWYLSLNGINIIPSVGWGFENTYDFCFDGLPKNSVLSVSTNGCFSTQGKECYRKGFAEMCRRLTPLKVLIVGRKIDVDTNIRTIYMDSFGQSLTKKLRS